MSGRFIITGVVLTFLFPNLSTSYSTFRLLPRAAGIHARAVITSPNGGPVRGNVEFYGLSPTEVRVTVAFSGLDKVLPIGEHAYHVHTNPLPSDGNCEGAGPHLSPNGIPDSEKCSAATPILCQEGNLSGKHGTLSGAQSLVQTAYVDNYLRFAPENESILGRSVVIHGNNGIKLACGNITIVNDIPGVLPNPQLAQQPR